MLKSDFPGSFYVHIPFCISKCRYCDFFSKTCYGKNIPEEYVDAVVNEINHYFKKFRLQNDFNKEYKISTIYVGGGTPSLLTENQISKILNAFYENGTIGNNFECTFEANPDDINKEYLKILEKYGVNRISVGIQSLNSEVLKYTERRAGFSENIAALDCIKKYWNGRFSVDIISALPGESESSFINNLKKIIEYNPDHISMYSLTIEDETPLGKDFNNGNLEYDFDKADEMWILGREFLLKNGYFQYEISNFSKKSYESKHNMAYWKHQSYIGIGCGACGTIYNQYGNGKRYTNRPDINLYVNFWKNWNKQNVYEDEKISEISEIEFIDAETSRFEFFMMGLRKLSGITDLEYFNCFKEEIPEKIIKIFEKWNKEKLLEITQERSVPSSVIVKRYALNHKGILFLNRLLEQI